MAAEGDRPAGFAGCRGLLLMGGRSARFGRDKAWIEWEREPLWRRQVRLLATRVDEVWRALPYGSPAGPDDLVDPVPYPGPWWAIRAALARLDPAAPWLAVLAVDLPGVPVALLDRLWAARIPGGVALSAAGAVRQPLAAVWHRGVLDATEDVPSEGIPLGRVLERVPCRAVVLSGDEVEWLHNVNTPRDWERWAERGRRPAEARDRDG
ncbi:MAG: molybdenum cofactor guanylyltransferase [Actinomycetia bacterium]|nr:molybdenum cofactor guanylyltransferase [Actinomycetes bacterium]